MPLRSQRSFPAVAADEISLSAVQSVYAHKELQHRGLAAAAVSCECNIFALFYVNADVLDDLGHIRLGQLSDAVNGRIICKAGIAYAKGAQLLGVVSADLAYTEGSSIAVVGKILYFHKSFRACGHCIILGQVSRNIGKRSLYLRYELSNGGKGAVADSADEYAVAAVADAKEVHTVHGCLKSHIAQV